MSTRYLTLHELCDVVERKTGVPVDPAAIAVDSVTINDLGIDSLGWLGVITEVENRYGVTLGPTAETVATLPELIRMVNGADATPGHTDNRIVIAAPLDLVWRMTNDVGSWPELFSEYAEATILANEGDTVRFRLTTRPDEAGTTYSWVSERTPDRETLTVRAHRVETGIFEFMHIRWAYQEVGGGVEMRWIQDFAVKPDAPVDIDQATAYIDNNSKIQMARIKSLVEKAAEPTAARV